MDLPLELLEQYQKGRVLVFLGQGINGPEWSRLGQKLADRLKAEDLKDTAITEELAELYESVHGTQALVQTVLDFYNETGGARKVHHLLASFKKCRHYVTTCVDQRLEQAFKEAKRPLSSIIHHSDLPFGPADDARLYHLYGVISQPETLRLTQEQTADVLSLLEEEGLSDVVKGHLADSTIIFVGFNLDDDFFKQMYRGTIKSLHRYHPRSYAFTQQNYKEVTRRFCQRNNIEIVTAGLDDILTAFIRALEQHGLDEPPPPPTEDTSRDTRRIQPYKRLLSYRPEDRLIFFGRQNESEQLLALIQANQLVILYGDSGAGKSSLIGAGLIPRLKADEYLVWSERVLKSPLDVLRGYTRTLPEPPTDDSLVALLDCASKQQPLVIILDQFEEFFTRLEASARADFVRELSLVLSRRDLPVKWLLALRSESLARLNEFRLAIPDIFKAELYLTPLNLTTAAEAISGPAILTNLGVEPELQKSIISDLEQEGWISPPQLQIICYDVYQAALAKDDNTLRLEYYKERGGAKEIIANYLEQALRHLPPQAKQVLIAFISGDGTPEVLNTEAIADRIGVTVEETAKLLAQLENEWLVKMVSYEDQPNFELAHAFLAAKLAVDPDVLQHRAMEELLHRNVQDWQRYHIMLNQEELHTLRNWVEKIDLSHEEQELLVRSAIHRNYDLSYWLVAFEKNLVQTLLKEFLNGSETTEPQPEMGLAALESVPQREPYIDDLCKLLQSPTLSFVSRKQAALYLAQMNPALTLKTLRDGSGPLQLTNRQVLIELYNAQATQKLRLGESPSWTERFSIWFSRLRANTGYLLARIGTACLAASVGGLIGSLAGYSFIQGKYGLYLFGAVFVPFIWALGLALGITLAETLRLNQNLGTQLAGAIIGGLPLVAVAATDRDPQVARLGLIYGLVGALISGTILAAALHFSTRKRSGSNALLAVTGAAIAGLAYSLVFRPLVGMVGTTDIPGFNLWSLAGILAGGAVSMMLGLLFVPVQIFASGK